MPDEPQGRSAGGSIQHLGAENGQDRTTPKEATEPGRKRNAAEADWLSMATADPAHFLKDVLSE
jgi:hypothetical protein